MLLLVLLLFRRLFGGLLWIFEVVGLQRRRFFLCLVFLLFCHFLLTSNTLLSKVRPHQLLAAHLQKLQVPPQH